MGFTIHSYREHLKLVIFDLPAVINYSQDELKPLLRSAVEESLGREISLNTVSWEENCSGVLLDIYKRELDRFPSNQEYLLVKNSFLHKLKNHFIKLEGLYDVQHGVQNIIVELQASPEWAFCIVSDYWKEATHFMLDSCGVYRKNIDLYTADDALSNQDLVGKLTGKYYQEKRINEVYLISEQNPLSAAHSHDFHFISTKGGGRNSLNYFSYPKFTDLFKQRVNPAPEIS